MIEALAGAILSQEWGWGSVRRDAFLLLALGYQDAETKIRQEHLEENITGLLRRAMNDRLNYDTTLPARFLLYNVKNEDPVDDTGKLGRSRPRVDVAVEHTGNRPARQYVFEAKRSDRRYEGGIQWYVKGIMSFVRRDYAREAPEASVVGLVQTDTPEHWREALKAYTGKEASLMCESLPTDVNLFPNLPTMAISTHRRDDQSLIDLYHVFLDCIKP